MLLLFCELSLLTSFKIILLRTINNIRCIAGTLIKVAAEPLLLSDRVVFCIWLG